MFLGLHIIVKFTKYANCNWIQTDSNSHIATFFISITRDSKSDLKKFVFSANATTKNWQDGRQTNFQETDRTSGLRSDIYFDPHKSHDLMKKLVKNPVKLWQARCIVSESDRNPVDSLDLPDSMIHLSDLLILTKSDRTLYDKIIDQSDCSYFEKIRLLRDPRMSAATVRSDFQSLFKQ